MTRDDPGVRAAAMGAAAGMRSMLPLAVLSRRLAEDEAPGRSRAERTLAHPAVRALTGLAAGGELLGDKLPWVPNRVDPGPLVVRALVGAAGGAMVESGRRPPVVGAVIGATAAVGSACAMYLARQALTRRAGLPDLLVALAEDALAVGLARSACRPSR